MPAYGVKWMLTLDGNMADRRVVGPGPLGAAVSRLQSAGGTIGVAGAVPPVAYRRLTRYIQTGASHNREIIGYVGPRDSAEDWIDRPHNDRLDIQTELIRLDSGRRIAVKSTNEWTGITRPAEVCDDASEFMGTIESRLDALRDQSVHHPLISVYPVGYLAEQCEWNSIEPWICDTSALVRDMSGLAFYHLDRGVENKGAQQVADLFDAFCVLRTERDGQSINVKMRWHIIQDLVGFEGDVESEWIDLPSGTHSYD